MFLRWGFLQCSVVETVAVMVEKVERNASLQWFPVSRCKQRQWSIINIFVQNNRRCHIGHEHSIISKSYLAFIVLVNADKENLWPTKGQSCTPLKTNFQRNWSQSVISSVYSIFLLHSQFYTEYKLIVCKVALWLCSNSNRRK